MRTPIETYESIGTLLEQYKTGTVVIGDVIDALTEASEVLAEVLKLAAAPDWSRAQKWARFWAVNADGKAYWFPAEPTMINGKWTAEQSGYFSTFDRHLPYLGWETSLHRR
jgi:hypothetical protein